MQNMVESQRLGHIRYADMVIAELFIMMAI